KNALEQVKGMAGASFGLQDNYADVFSADKKVNNKEIVFAINYERDQSSNNVYNLFLINAAAVNNTMLNAGSANQGLVGTLYPNIISQGNRVSMTESIVNRLKNVTPQDRRITYSIASMHTNTTGYPLIGVLLTKYIGNVYEGLRIYDNDYPVYRYADVLLLLAEAKTKLGESPDEEINAIRQRAYGTGYTVFANGKEVQNMDAILEEYLRGCIGRRMSCGCWQKQKLSWEKPRTSRSTLFAKGHTEQVIRYLPTAMRSKTGMLYEKNICGSLSDKAGFGGHCAGQAMNMCLKTSTLPICPKAAGTSCYCRSAGLH